MKRKKLMAAALGLVLLTLVSACGRKENTAETVTDVLADGVLTVGIINGEDAFCRTGSNGYAGIEPMILNAYADAAEISVRYEEMSSPAALYEALSEGKIDLAAGRLTQEERMETAFTRSRSYASRGLYLVTDENRYVSSLVGLGRGTIGVSSWIPQSTLDEVQNIENFEVSKMDSDADAERSGKEIAQKEFLNTTRRGLICTEREAIKLIRDQASVHVAELYESPSSRMVFYMPKGQTKLEDGLNQAIEQYINAAGGN